MITEDFLKIPSKFVLRNTAQDNLFFRTGNIQLTHKTAWVDFYLINKKLIKKIEIFPLFEHHFICKDGGHTSIIQEELRFFIIDDLFITIKTDKEKSNKETKEEIEEYKKFCNEIFLSE